ncbi:MAG TPA: hypothetical protein VFN97_25065 [Actinospica sp.]|nr:hypothetical protein [Actinospica sp.]
MSVSGTMRQFADKTKGRALQMRGRITGKRRTEAHGELLDARGDARASARRLTRRLRGLAHR